MLSGQQSKGRVDIPLIAYQVCVAHLSRMLSLRMRLGLLAFAEAPVAVRVVGREGRVV
jgi:hypothetical protein